MSKLVNPKIIISEYEEQINTNQLNANEKRFKTIINMEFQFDSSLTKKEKLELAIDLINNEIDKL